MLEVEWTGNYPCLCMGEWIIKKDGVDVSECIPKELISNPMNTFNIYSEWMFGEDWLEEWKYYEDGLDCDEWIENNKWIEHFCDNYDEEIELYNKINEHDWRSSSCGGCI